VFKDVPKIRAWVQQDGLPDPRILAINRDKDFGKVHAMKDSEAKNPQFDSKWWTARASDKAAGSGMEAALDNWKAKCKDPAGFKSIKEFDAAEAAAKQLEVAVDKASKKCGNILQKSTKNCLATYSTETYDYRHDLGKARKKFEAQLERQRAAAEEEESEAEEQEELARAAAVEVKALKGRIKSCDQIISEYEAKYKVYLAAKKAATGGDDIYELASADAKKLKAVEAAKKEFLSLQTARSLALRDVIKAIQSAIKKYGADGAMKPVAMELGRLEKHAERDVVVK